MPKNKEPLKRFAWWRNKVSKDEKLREAFRQGVGRPAREDSVKRACKAFGLDAENQTDRDLLLGVLAAVHFPGGNALAAKRRGAPLKWSEAKEKQLVEDLCSLWPDRPPYPSLRELAELLQKEFNKGKEKRYPMSVETLEKYLKSGPPSGIK